MGTRPFSFTPQVNGEVISADDINELQDAIEALDSLGTTFAQYGGSTPRKGWTGGRYMASPYNHPGFISGTGAAVTINRVYGGPPFFFHRASPVTAMGIWVNIAGAAGTVARLGFYNINANGLPTTLALDAGTVTVATTGAKEITGLNWTPTADTWYVPVCVSSGTPQLFRAPVASGSPAMFYGANAISNTAMERNHSVYDTVVGTTFTDPFQVDGYMDAETGPIVIWIKQT